MTKHERNAARSARRIARNERDRAARSLAALIIDGHSVESNEVQCVLTHFLTHAKRVEVHEDIIDAIVTEEVAL